MSKKELKEENNDNNNSKENQENLNNNNDSGFKNDENVVEESLAQKKEKIIDLEKKLEDLQDKNLRLMAELQNQEKNHREEITETIKYGNEKLLQQFLFFPDNYERAQQAVQQIDQEISQKIKQDEQISKEDLDILQKKNKDLFQGLQMILVWFQNTLQKQGVEEIKVTPFKTIFDPILHTILEEKINDDYSEGTILEVLQKGYKINQRILRPTLVKISESTKKK